MLIFLVTDIRNSSLFKMTLPEELCNLGSRSPMDKAPMLGITPFGKKQFHKVTIPVLLLYQKWLKKSNLTDMIKHINFILFSIMNTFKPICYIFRQYQQQKWSNDSICKLLLYIKIKLLKCHISTFPFLYIPWNTKLSSVCNE